jgi:NADPH:quinone reductase-like Zn-dependent oxidoreductase
MRQAVLDHAFGIDKLGWRDVSSPEPGAGQVLVTVRATSLNYRDYLVVTGRYNPRMPLPRVPLSDGAGEVVAVGDGVKRFAVGDRVAGAFMQGWRQGRYRDSYASSALGGAIDGMLAEYVVLDAEGLVAMPTHLSFVEAATLPCAAVTAWNALFESGDVKPGDTVLVQGTGGVSIFALQFAKAAGARVIATSSHPDKIEKLKAMGADWVLNYKEVPDWGRAILKAGGVDAVVEVGGVGSLEQSLIAVRGGGQVNVIGILSGASGSLNIAPILHKHITMQGIYVGSVEMFENMNRAITQNQLRPVVDSTFEADQIQVALRYMESAAHFGKIVVEF